MLQFYYNSDRTDLTSSVKITIGKKKILKSGKGIGDR